VLGKYFAQSVRFGGPLKTTILGSLLKMCDPEDEEEKEYDCLDEHDDEDKEETEEDIQHLEWLRRGFRG
tara:strand:+ start:154 stop:360 length:207 start_codon:yes stop_codon:yes gene_type:complete